jgi:hypothetical protein
MAHTPDEKSVCAPALSMMLGSSASRVGSILSVIIVSSWVVFQGPNNGPWDVVVSIRKFKDYQAGLDHGLTNGIRELLEIS